MHVPFVPEQVVGSYENDIRTAEGTDTLTFFTQSRYRGFYQIIVTTYFFSASLRNNFIANLVCLSGSAQNPGVRTAFLRAFPQ